MENGIREIGTSTEAAECWNRLGVKGDRTCPQLAEAVHCRNCPVFAEAGQQLFNREPPPEYLEEWTRELAQDKAPPPTDTLSVIVFRIADEWLALDVRAMVEVVEQRTLHRIP